MSNDILKVWNELGNKILASILVDNLAYIPVAEVVASDLTLWPPLNRPIWKAVMGCVDSDTLPTLEAVQLRLNGDKTVNGQLASLAKQWNDDDNAKIIYHAEEMKRVGMLAKLRAIGRELANLEDVNSLAEAVGQADVGLSSISALQTDRQGDAASVLESAWAEVESFKGDGILTGLAWFDRLTGGIWPGFNYWVVAAYKCGKSTLMRNIALNVARAGHPIDIYCAEGTREMFALDIQSMIATGLMLDRGERTDKLRLSGHFIKRAWAKEFFLTKDEIDAIDQAGKMFEALPIRVWDSKDGIRDRATIKHIIKRSKLDNGSHIHMLDHAQLIGNEPTIYDRMSNTALMVQDLSVSESIAFWMLSQRNESAIRGEAGHSSGVKGGGDADAAADFTLIPSIDQVGYNVKLKHSRHTSAGASEYHSTNLSSGLIIDKWLTKVAL